MEDTGEFRKKLGEAMEAHLRAIDGAKEALVQAWVAQHGFNPDETQLVQQATLDGWRMWVEKRGDFDELKLYREREELVQALVKNVIAPEPWEENACVTYAERVRDFKLSASAAEVAATPPAPYPDLMPGWFRPEMERGLAEREAKSTAEFTCSKCSAKFSSYLNSVMRGHDMCPRCAFETSAIKGFSVAAEGDGSA